MNLHALVSPSSGNVLESLESLLGSVMFCRYDGVAECFKGYRSYNRFRAFRDLPLALQVRANLAAPQYHFFLSLSRSLSLSNLKLRPPRRKLRQERSKQKQHFRSSPPLPRLVPAGRYPAKHDGKVQAEGREEHGQSDFAASSLVHPHVGLCRCRRTAVMQLRSVLCIADHCRLWMRASSPLTVPDRSGGQSCAW